MRFHITLFDTATHSPYWSIVEAETQGAAYLKARTQIIDVIAESEKIDPRDTSGIALIKNDLEFSSVAYVA